MKKEKKRRRKQALADQKATDEVQVAEEAVPEKETKQDQEQGSEVILLTAYYPYLADVVCMTFPVMDEILAKTSRKFGKLFRIGHLEHLQYEAPPKAGTGVLLIEDMGECDHVEVLWRGLDGTYFFFDSYRSCCVPATLKRLMERKWQATQLYFLTQTLQGESQGTCAYHSLAFADYISQRP